MGVRMVYRNIFKANTLNTLNIVWEMFAFQTTIKIIGRYVMWFIYFRPNYTYDNVSLFTIV